MADEIETARQSVARAIACSATCRAVVLRLRDRAYEQFGRKAISIAQYNEIDGRCDTALQNALAMIDTATRALGPEIDAGLSALATATDQLGAAADAIEKAGDVVALSASLLESVLAVAAAVVDPTHVSVVAAVAAVQSTIKEIIKQAASSDGAAPPNSDPADDGAVAAKAIS